MNKQQQKIIDVSREVSSKVGDDFFRALVLELSEALGCNYGLIAQIDKENATSNILGICADGEIGENFSYSLAGTPCADVKDTGVCIFECDVQIHFPDDQILKDINAESFVGIGLTNSKQECIGILEVLDRNPITEPEKVEEFLRVFGSRASAEIERRELTISLEENIEAYRTLFELSNDSHLLINAKKLSIIDCNNSAVKYFNLMNKQGLIGKSAAHLFGQSNITLQSILNITLPEAELSITEQFQRIETQLIDHKKELFFVELTTTIIQINGESRILLVIRDLTATHKALDELNRSQREYQFLAFNDPLTLLQNRRALQNKLHSFETVDHKCDIFMMILDLDNFKEVNDSLGHLVGDQLLKQLAQRLQTTLSNTSTHLFRLGGDEFAVLLEEQNQKQITALTKNLITLIENPFDIGGMEICVNCSIGLAKYNGNMSSSSDLMRAADIAMYQSKASSSERYHFYDLEMDVHSRNHLQLVSDLRSGLDKGEIVAFYQPKIDLSDMSIVGFEALARWQHPKLGMIAPDVFIEIAEVSNNIQMLTDKILKDACHALRKLPNNQHYNMAINISPRILLDSSFLAKLEEVLSSCDISANQLELEITESTLMKDPERALIIATKIAKLGMKLSVDDFGTGYSSLAYLKRLPVTTLKIDREFIKDMVNDEQDKVIVQSVIDLAKNLGMNVIAEGIEDEATQTLLQTMRCHQAQGYLYAKPFPEHQLSDWVSKWNALH